MDSSFSFSERDQRAGLVIVFPLGVSGLFNPEIHGLVQEVERQLDGIFVTYAVSSGASPTVKDAIGAARFVGCKSAVVVLAVEHDAAWPVDCAPSGDWLLTPMTVRDELDASAIVDAYRSALDAAEKAA